MPEYLAPGVYVEEVDTGAKPIEGVSTSTAGMVGLTERGPENVPTLVTGVADFSRKFGWYLDRRVFTFDTWYLPHAVKGFFDNGGKRLYIVRVLPDRATAATTQLYDRGDTGVGFNTALATRAEQGDRVILVDSAAGINGGDSFLISDRAASEYGQWAGSAATPVGLLSLGTPASNGQAANTPVVGNTLTDAAPPTPRQLATNDVSPGDTSILLNDVTGLNAAGGDLLLIQHGAGPTDLTSFSELIVTDSANPLDATVPVVLRTPLAFGHTVAPVTRVRLVTATVVGTTPLAHPTAAGDRLINVTDTTQLAGSQAIGFGGPPSTEFHPLGNVGAVAVLTSIGLNQNANTPVAVPTFTVDATARTLTLPAAVDAHQLTLDDRTGLVPGSILRITDGGTAEFVLVDDVVPPISGGTNPGVITLRTPVRRAYAATQAVELVTDNNTDTDPTFLARDANPGERGLVLTDASAYVAGTTLRLGDVGSPLVEYHELTASTLAIIPLAQPLDAAHTAGSPVLGRSLLLTVQSIDRGSWGNSLLVTVDDDSPILDTMPSAPAVAGSPTLTLQSVVGIEVGTVLEFYRVSPAGIVQPVFVQKVESVLSGNRVGFGPGNLAQAVTPDMRVRTREFRLIIDTVRFNPRTQKEELVTSLAETLRQLSLDPRHTRYVMRVVGPINPTLTNPFLDDGRTAGESEFIRVDDALTPAQAQTTLRVGPDILSETLSTGRTRLIGRRLRGGDDQIALVADTTYVGADAINPIDRTGLFALKNIEHISIVAIPGRTSQFVQQELITHCELMRYRFAVIDSREGDGVAEVQAQRGLYDTKYAALYYPWLRIVDPFPDNPRAPGSVEIPSSGHILGIYARSDIERGVHKAPANEVIRNIADLEFKLTKEEQDILNPQNINVLRNFREINRGLRVWGARTLTSDPDWKYVNVRRLFIFVEHSIDRGTQWVVFEPNSEALWERVRRAVSAFLTNVWRDGALMGKTREEAYFVKCDRTTMTQADIDNGRLIVQVGIAPVKPAEFVIFRIGQWAGGSELDEG